MAKPTKPRTCGNCEHFVRISSFSGKRNGICDKHDYNVHADSGYGRHCPSYKGKRYTREKAGKPK